MTRPDAAPPIENSTAAAAVGRTRDDGIAAPEASWASNAASDPPERDTARRDTRFASIDLPLRSRPESVPTGQPTRRAASSCVVPSRSQRTMGVRYFRGSRANSRSSTASRSSGGRGVDPGSGITATVLSLDLCLARIPFALRAVRQATPCSQFPTIPGGTTEAARRARTRKVAWKASWVSWWSPRARRHTPQTIGPWRRTRASNDAPSLVATNRSSSCSSENPPSAPESRSVWRSRIAAPLFAAFVITSPLGFEPLATTYCPVALDSMRRFLDLRAIRANSRISPWIGPDMIRTVATGRMVRAPSLWGVTGHVVNPRSLEEIE